MAAVSAASKLSAMQQLIKSDKTMPVMSDDSILVKKIVEEHAPIGLEYDVKPLFHLVEDIFRRSTLSTEGVSTVSNNTLINLPHELYLDKFNLNDSTYLLISHFQILSFVQMSVPTWIRVIFPNNLHILLLCVIIKS